jgi:hypothetical protein
MNQQEARKFVREHLKRKGNIPVTLVTTQLVRKWWRIFNIAVFDGILNMPDRVVIKLLKSTWAWARESTKPKKVNITMCDHFSSKRLFLTVLIHEMVHAWELHLHNTMSHGPTFKRWAGRIKRITGLPLEVIV